MLMLIVYRNRHFYAIIVHVTCVLLASRQLKALGVERQAVTSTECHLEVVLDLHAVAVNAVQERS